MKKIMDVEIERKKDFIRSSIINLLTDSFKDFSTAQLVEWYEEEKSIDLRYSIFRAYEKREDSHAKYLLVWYLSEKEWSIKALLKDSLTKREDFQTILDNLKLPGGT